MATRIYVVTNRGTGASQLVEAASRAEAIRHCTRQMYDASPASAKDVAEAMKDGVEVETAGKSESEEVQ